MAARQDRHPSPAPCIAAKWGVRGLVRVLRIENRDLPGVPVCAVAPAGVDTPISRQAAKGSRLGRTGEHLDPRGGNVFTPVTDGDALRGGFGAHVGR